MTDIQSFSSISRIKSHFLLGESAQLRRKLPRPSAYCFNTILAVVFVGVSIVQLFQAPRKEFSCLKKLYPRDISCELVKWVFPGSFLLCLTTVHNK